MAEEQTPAEKLEDGGQETDPSNSEDKAAPDEGSKDGEKPGEEAAARKKDPQADWYKPGKYRTQADAIEALDKERGRLASEVGQMKKMMAELVKQTAKPEEKRDTNPETGRQYTQEELHQQWNEFFERDPVGARIAWDKMQADIKAKEREEERQREREELKREIARSMTWEGFVAQNPEFSDEEKIAQLRQLFAEFPSVGNRKDGLMAGKEILACEGETLEDKYIAWKIKERETKQRGVSDKGQSPSPQPAPGAQTTVGKGGKRDAVLDLFDSLDRGTLR